MSADTLDVVVAQLRKDNEELQKKLDGAVSRELVVSVLKGAEAQLDWAEKTVRSVADEVGKQRVYLRAFLARIEKK